ncbi:MAG TPA: hypothetical protein VI750_07865 [Pyrinomonadaceae bacterium]|nr:hypothetical protein [Pyrinomonadaceae bacterium]
MRTILTVALLLAAFLLAGCSGDAPKDAPRPVGAASDPISPKPDTPLPDRALKAELTLAEPLTTLKPGEKKTIKVKVKNASDVLWIVHGTGEGSKYRVAVGNSWLDSKGQLVTNMDGRYGLPLNLAPGRDVEVPLAITAPAQPGDYILELDIVQEGVAWFKDKGSEVLKVNVKVQ